MQQALFPPIHAMAMPPGDRRVVRPLAMKVAEPSSAPTGPGDDEGRRQARLIAALGAGDREALGQLYDALSRPLYSLAFRITQDAAEAQDIVQDVFVKISRQATTYRVERGSVFSWAATLTRNRAIDRLRSRRRRDELLTAAAEELQPAAAPGGLDTAAALWLREKAAAVRIAVNCLAPEQQQAIELAYFSGLTQQEIAARLNEPLGTVKARIRRGLLKLRETLPARL
ncbi:MAG TPA: sigma-70 family RNA polymerase sigma factor [Lacunisphaera sp.]|jgi:RNA polymerase sigma-70 factor (ECF subfamily)|nr:sigma-70 family RNA polymerase sigma factor [Lacunisphaera sp.]